MLFYLTFTNGLFLLRGALMGQGRARRWIYFVVLLLLFLFAAFRFEVGCDWGGYIRHYNAQAFSDLGEALSQREPLWWVWLEIVHGLGLPYPWINIGPALLFFGGVHVLARRQPDPLGFLILLFPILILNMPMSAVRQGAAIGLLCLAFCAFIDKRVVWFTVWTVLASTFHSSALIFLLLIPLVGGEYSRRRLALATVLAIPGAFALMAGASGEVATTRYIQGDRDAAGAVYRSGLLLVTGLAYLLLFQKRWKEAFPRDYKLASIAALMLIAVMFLLPLSTIIANRVGYYMIPLQALILARIPYLPRLPMKPLLSAAPYLGLSLVFLVYTSFSNIFHNCYLPYQTWIFGMPSSSYFW